MIDVEKELFTLVSTEIREKFPRIYMTGEYVPAPPSFPCASVVEVDNTPVRRTQSSDSSENHATLLYEVNIYSNKKAGKETECRAIAAVIDEVFQRLGFERVLLRPVDNVADATIYRMTGRYRAVVSENNVIYRR